MKTAIKYVWSITVLFGIGIMTGKPLYAQTTPPPYIPKVIYPSLDLVALMKFADVLVSPFGFDQLNAQAKSLLLHQDSSFKKNIFRVIILIPDINRRIVSAKSFHRYRS